MPHHRRGNDNRNNRRNEQPGEKTPQADASSPENPPGQDKAQGQARSQAGQSSRSRQRRPGRRPSSGVILREISPSEVNERLNQRGNQRQGKPQASDGAAPQPNAPRRRSGQQGQARSQGNTPQRRNPAGKSGAQNKNTSGKNTSNRAKDSVITPSSKPGSRTSGAPRRGYFVQRSSFTDRGAPSMPIRTNKGIKARNQRGQFSQNWWARRWIEAMEGLVDQARLQRGRSYARSGQVLSLVEMGNGIEARVQGSRPKPYEVTIQVTPLNDRQWDQVIDALSEQALFTAQLLAGEMPGNIEDAFNTAGVSLFPTQTGDLSSDCTCPDWANPCKHVAATHYILGDRFDDDPFLLFRMRGRTQEEILEALRQRRSETGESTEEPAPEEELAVEVETVTPLEDTIDRFWEPVEPLDTFPLTIRLASVDMALFKRLGEPGFMGGESIQALLKPFYDVFTRNALRAAYSEEEPLESNNGNGDGNGRDVQE